jgi:hypothetical protein
MNGISMELPKQSGNITGRGFISFRKPDRLVSQSLM